MIETTDVFKKKTRRYLIDEINLGKDNRIKKLYDVLEKDKRMKKIYDVSTKLEKKKNDEETNKKIKINCLYL